MASDKQCTLHGEDNNVMVEDDSQEVIVKENGNNWAEVVSKAPNKVDYNLSGIKDDIILLDLDLASSRPLEDICNMALKPIVESSTHSLEKTGTSWAASVDERFNAGVSSSFTAQKSGAQCEEDVSMTFFPEMESTFRFASAMWLAKMGCGETRYSKLGER
ncbi:hypothetical protein V6N12_047934 [Hibiscus sabdariffa]|uniref:Uncharacterized protein n=1 Tax=Hibiscus sabdariffa TaxID=183260 RepID=A0ABR2CUE6_9ROSI